MTSRKKWFINCFPFETPISIGLGDDSIIKAVGSGLVKISMTVDRISRLFKLWDIYYVLDMRTNNLLSVTYMIQRGYTINFGAKLYEISKAGSVIKRAKNKKRLWVLDRNSVMQQLSLDNLITLQVRVNKENSMEFLLLSVYYLCQDHNLVRICI